MSYFHIPVLLKEAVELIDPKPGENLVDGTVGGGGHAGAILEMTAPNGKLLGIDFDSEALAESKRRLQKFAGRIFFERGNYREFEDFSKKNGVDPINIFFLDLGISSHQLDDENLGISFLGNHPLDMRLGGYNQNYDDRTTAETILNSGEEGEIEDVLKKYGEERYAKLIAREIASKRKEHRIVNTAQLVAIIEKAVPSRYKKQKIHFATKTFQALRIAVNKELENLSDTLPEVLKKMPAGGRIAVISFHSLEDRIVKRFFQRESKNCICGPEVPVCACNHKKSLEIITKKAARPTEEEIARNPRARSAKLRVARKI